MTTPWRIPLILTAGLLASPVTGMAGGETGLEFSGTGFMTLAAGKILSGTHDATVDQGFHCPCFISDYAQRGVYQAGAWQLGPDSRLGLQGTASADHGRYSVTGQVVSRGAMDGQADLEWLYATAELSGNLTLQVGRKRLPLFNHSEAQDVGFALPWVHLPPQLYGWEIVNYDGGSLVWRDQWAGWMPSVQIFGGNETRKDSGYWQIYNGRHTRTDTRWSNILGTEFSLNRDWFSARVIRIQSYTQNKGITAGDTGFSDRKRQIITGLSLGADYGNWITRGEFLHIDRTQDYGKDYAQLLAVGYRLGAWQPLMSYTNYRQQLNDATSAAEAHRTWSGVLRYDLTDASAVKIQADIWKDKSTPGFASMHGDAKLLTISYDRVF